MVKEGRNYPLLQVVSTPNLKSEIIMELKDRGGLEDHLVEYFMEVLPYLKKMAAGSPDFPPALTDFIGNIQHISDILGPPASIVIDDFVFKIKEG